MRRTALLFPCIVLLLCAMTGCKDTVCDLACEKEMEAVAGCLGEWDMTWSDFDFEDRQDALIGCKERYDEALRSQRELDEEQRDPDAILQACTDLSDNLDRARDCDDVSRAGARQPSQ